MSFILFIFQSFRLVYSFFKNILFISFWGLLIIPTFSYGTHLVGGDLSVQKVGSLKYEVTLNYYFDCDGSRAAFSTPQQVFYNSSCGSGSIWIDTISNTGNDIAPVCPSNISSCNGGTTKGIEKYVFRDTVTLPAACSDWTFSWSDNARNHAITTISNPGSQWLYLEATVNNSQFPDNNIPRFTNDPVAFICNNQDFVYNHGAVDPDGDSLVYSLYTPKTGALTTVNYLSGYSAQQPIKSSPPVSIDSATGDITMHPTQTDITVLGVKVEEFDSTGTLKSVILRDIQVIINNCTSPNPPKIGGFDTANSSYDTSYTNFDTTVCPGQTVELYINANDSDAGDQLNMSWNNGISSANFTVINNNTSNPTGKFTWTPPNPSAGVGIQRNTFTVNVSDNNCPYNTTISRGYVVNVVPSKTVDLGDTAYVACDDSLKLKPAVTGGGGDSSYIYNWSTGETTDSIWVQSPGEYWVTVSDSGNCPITDTIQVLPSLNPDYQITSSFDANRGCVNDSIQFSDSSTSEKATVNSWNWNFGDGNSSTLQNPKHKYADTGNYNVQLIITDTNSCQDTINKNIAVDSKPVADFSAQLACSRDSTQFNDSSSITKGSIYSWKWEFGDGGSSTVISPKHTYDTGGAYTITQYITSFGGCKDTVSKIFTIDPKPKADFSYSNACSGLTTYFFDSTTIEPEDSINSWQWSFGDGSSSTAQNPENSYTNSGNFPVKLIATSGESCKDSITKSIDINPPQVINTIADTTFCKGDSVELSLSITPGTFLFNENFDGGLNSSLWSFINNGSVGTYCSSLSGDALSFVGDGGNRQAVTVDLNTQFADTLRFYFKYGTANNGTFGSGCDAPEAGDEVDLQYSVDGGATWNTLKTLSTSQYSNFTEITARLPSGAKTSSTRFRWVQTNYAGCNIWGTCFDNWAIDEVTIAKSEDLYQASWSPSIGLSNDKALNPKASPNSLTEYVVEVTDTSIGCRVYDTVTLTPQKINPEIYSSAPECVFNEVFFADSSTIENGTFSATEWNFGDGTNSTNPVDTHQYVNSGNYFVKLIKTSTIGCRDSIQQTDTIYQDPVADFTFDTACLGENTNFTDQSGIPTGSVTSWSWNFAGMGSSSSQNPYFKFSTADSFDVTLIASSNKGCKDTVTKTIDIGAIPNSNFTSVSECENDTVSFNNTSSVSYGFIKEGKWLFGDGDSSLTTNPKHIYNSNGSYSVKLINISNFNCIDTISKTQDIYPYPEADFGVNDSTQCLTGNSFSFSDSTLIDSGNLNYSWSFGDGQTSTSSNPSHSYATEGSYTVELIVNSDQGCYDTVYRLMTVHPMPLANFSVNDSTQCKRNNFFSFTNNSSISSGSLSYNWNFGDGNTSTQTLPNHQYSTYGNYTTELVAISNKVCKDTAGHNIIVNPMPDAAFSYAEDSAQCFEGHSYTFTNNTTIAQGNVDYTWSFGDGNTSTLENPIHTYASPGNYDVKLVAVSDSGCKDSITRQITIHPMPVANFSIPDTAQCLDLNTFQFNNNSSVSLGSISYEWYFGDGNTSTSANPDHSYASEGQYTIQLVATSNKGCKDTLERQVTVHPEPQAAFSITNNDQCLSGNLFNFTNNTTLAYGSLSHDWDFDDGSSSTSTNPAHSYTYADSFNVQLITTSDKNCHDTQTHELVVDPQPEPGFTHTTECIGDTTSFTDTSFILSGSIIQHDWSFGDGQSSTKINPDHFYDSIGAYQAKLKLTSDQGCVDSFSDNVNVGAYPQMGFTPEVTCTIDSTQFEDTSVVAHGYNSQWQWSFGDGTTASVKNPKHVYDSIAVYDIQLIATTNFGCTDSLTKSINADPDPRASFSVNDSGQCLTGNQFQFTNSSQITSGTMTYQWLFKDGDSVNTENTSHIYDSAGVYPVTLVATSDKVCRDSAIVNVFVQHLPEVDFTVSDSAQCYRNNAYQLQNLTTIDTGTLSYNWSFGDGDTSSAVNPMHTYPDTGTYTVDLVATSNFGCQDSISRQYTVDPMPVADFNTNDTHQCLNVNNFQFTNQSLISQGTMEYYWYFGDGDSVKAQDPSHVYSYADTFEVILVAESDHGCQDTSTQKVIVPPVPSPDFAFTATCDEETTQFFDSSTVSSGAVTGWDWSFGDGDSSNSQNPAHLYDTAGNYTTTLITETGQGCLDTIQKSVPVRYKPIPDFSMPATCEFDTSYFTDQTSIGGADFISSWKWSFGNGETDTLQNPDLLYDTSGTFNVQLRVTTNYGCKDSISKNIIIDPLPRVGFTVTDPAQCLSGNQFQFTNTSNIASGSMNYTWDFGNGDSALINSPDHSYSNHGSYQAKLVAESNHGCMDSVSDSMTVHPMPEAQYTVNDSGQCQTGNQFDFTNNSSIAYGSMSYNWDFGDGNNSTQTTPNHIYNTYDTFNVQLKVNSNKGCKDSLKQSMLVYPMPTTTFSVTDSSQCLGSNQFQMNNNSTIPWDNLNYTWDFDDGNSSTLANPSHQYVDTGKYIITLTSVSPYGCATLDSHQVVTQSMPEPSYVINDSTQCGQGNLFQFTNTSIIGEGSMTYEWDFGDGQSSTQAAPSHSYNYQDTFRVNLTATSNKGCIDSTQHTTIAYPMPATVFDILDTNQCLSTNQVIFDNQTTISYGNLSYKWKFGDSDSSGIKDPVHTYADTGLFEVRLASTSDQGCVTHDTNRLTIQPMPRVEFAVNDVSQCLNGNSYQFTNQSSIPSGSIIDHNWHLGDGDTAQTIDVTHQYNDADTFVVTLTSTSNEGCIDSIKHEAHVDPMPSATFAVNDTSQCLRGNSFEFTNHTTVEWGNMVYFWDFKDGNSSAMENPVNSYLTPGKYEVFYEVTTGQGCKDSASQTLEVNPMPSADFQFNTACLGDTTLFQNQTHLASGEITNWEWRFGDGQSSADSNAGHLFQNPGDFTTSLIAESGKGCLDTQTRQVHVGYEPNADFNVAYQCSGDSILFTDQSTIGGADSIVAWKWDFGNGHNNVRKQNPKTLYQNPGDYNVQLIVASRLGCQDTVSKTVTIQPRPEAGFDYPATCFGDNITFNDTSIISSGNIVSYNWDFGDGNSSLAENPNHNYANPGNYNVSLVVQSGQGCRDTAIQNVYIGHIPTAGFSFEDICSGKSAKFTDTSKITTDSIRSWRWSFGDSDSSSVQNPVHAYNSPGKYEVLLTVESFQGCQDTWSDSANVEPAPVAAFSYEGKCLGRATQFFNQTSISSGGIIDSIKWYFGDGDSSGQSNPIHTYTNSGKYEVQLIARSQEGCFDTARKMVYISPTPQAQISVNNGTQCLHENRFEFTNNTSSSNGGLDYQWSFGDGDSSTQKAPTHSYTQAGVYNVTMVAMSDSGCMDSMLLQIEAYPQGNIGFTINQNSQCLRNNEFRFDNHSSSPSGVLLYNWDFGDSTQSTQEEPVHSYQKPGQYDVRLMIETPNACKDTLVKRIEVNSHPEAMFNSTRACLGDSTEFTSEATIEEGTISSWNYDFGDGKSSSKENPRHLYAIGGDYNVRQIVTSQKGCEDTFSRQVTVYGDPGQPEIIRATVENDENILIEWEPAPSDHSGNYLLERSVGEEPYEQIAYLDDKTLSYLDKNVDVHNNVYTYRLKMVDSCGNEGGYSSQVGTNIHLTVGGGEGNPTLNWTSYKGWNVEYYEIQVYNPETGQYETLDGYGRIRELSAIDSTSETGFEENCYRVLAYKANDSVVKSVSNTDCLQPEMRIYVPNAFSPDGNGINDEFVVKGTYVINYRIQIFSRWGVKVFESESMDSHWDGTYKGETVSPGIFNYIIKAEGVNGQFRTLKGKITVIR